MHFQIANTLGALAGFLDDLEQIPGYQDLPEETVFSLRLVIEDLLSNIVKHSNASKIGIDIAISSGGVSAQIRDDGFPFDPFFDVQKTEVADSIEDQEIGGMGIFLISCMTDAYAYRRENEENIVDFTIGDKQL